MVVGFIPPLRIAFAGGGVRVISHLGTLKALQEAKQLSAVQEWCGVSAGAFLATLCATGYKVAELDQLHRTVDFTKTRNEEPNDILTFLDAYGLDDGSALESFVVGYLEKKGLSRQSTFQDIYKKTGYKLRMWASALETKRLVEFSTQKTPNYAVVPCLRASMSLPFLYTPYIHPITKEKLLDGGCLLLNPIEGLTQEEQAVSLGIQFSEDSERRLAVNSFDQFALGFLNLFSRTTSPKDVKAHPLRHRIIWSPCGSFPAWNVDLTETERQTLFQCGYHSAQQFLERSKKGAKPKRRWSVA